MLLVLGAAPARAQPASPPDTASPPGPVHKNALQVWVGGAPGSVRALGRIEGARFGAIGVRYLRPFEADTQRMVEYTADVLPLASMTYEPVLGAPDDAMRRGERTLYGVGLIPAGLRIRAQTGRAWQPYLQGGIGFIYFTDPLPDRRGERFNFTLQGGVGMRIEVHPPVALTLGYRFHHLSNGFRGQINPGFDSHLFHLGVTLARF